MNEIKGCLTKATLYFASLENWQPPKGAWLEEPTDGRRQTWDADSDAKVLAELMGPRRKGEKEGHVEGRRAVGEIFQIVRRTGMRPGEVRTLEKSQLDFINRLVVVTSKKGMSERRTARTREVPMTDDVYAILLRRYVAAPGKYLFPGNSPDAPLSAYLSVFRKACERAGVPYGLSGGLILNDARRTAENEMLEAGHSARAVGDIFGHSAETMAKHYARSTREQRRRAVESAGKSVHEMATVATIDSQSSQSSLFSEEEKVTKAASGE
jgi:integrase